MNSPVKHRKQRGLTLVEIMVALMLSLFLTGGVIQVYLSNKSNYRFGEALARIQENGRFAMEILSRDIRMADFWGCSAASNPGGVRNLLDTASPDYDPNLTSVGSGIIGQEASGLNGSDQVTLRGAFGDPVYITDIPQTTAATLAVTKPSGLNENEIVIVSDCQNADIFQITDINDQAGGSNKEQLQHNTGSTSPGNTDQNLSKRYGPDAQVMRPSFKTYYVRANANGEPSLFLLENGVADIELAPGVEQMQILYGEDTNSDNEADRYVTADTAGLNFDEVVSVRVSLLIRSQENNVADDNQTYTYNGADVAAVDRRLRQIFTATVSVRNRIL